MLTVSKKTVQVQQKISMTRILGVVEFKRAPRSHASLRSDECPDGTDSLRSDFRLDQEQDTVAGNYGKTEIEFLPSIAKTHKCSTKTVSGVDRQRYI